MTSLRDIVADKAISNVMLFGIQDNNESYDKLVTI